MKPQMESQGLSLSDERRELVRIDDKLLFEYRLVGELPEAPLCETSQATEEAITAFVARPTQDLLANAQTNEPEAFLGPWLMKLDWTLTLMLKALARMSPEPLAIPRLAEVNISGGGLSFKSLRLFQGGDQLEMRLILPPFIPILATAEVIRVIPTGQSTYAVATRFVSIKSEDRERLIHHVFQVQAERLRSRFLQAGR